jgi:hypothetical protein
VRQFRKDLRSPFRLPGVFRWIALAMGAFLTFVYIAGGWGSPDIVVGSGQGPLLFILGLVVVGAYVPLYLWRRRTDRLDGLPPLVALPDVAELAAAQAIRDGTKEAAPILVGAHVDGAGMEAARIIDAPDEAPATG